MRLFKKKATRLVRQHLARLGLPAYSLDSALEAIRHCEAGNEFEPVMTPAGPFSARSLVAALQLEPFVERQIEWGAIEDRSPFLVGVNAELFDSWLEEAGAAWEELYAPDRNPALSDPAVHGALVNLALGTAASPSAGTVMDETGHRIVWSLGSGGYIWRRVESSIRGWADFLDGSAPPARDDDPTDSHTKARRELLAAIREVIAKCPRQGVPRETFLSWSATQITLAEKLPLWNASPGGWATGGDFLRAGYGLVSDAIVPPEANVAGPDRWTAFIFGVALYDVDQLTR